MHIRALLRRFREQSLGQSLTEFALILPVFLVVLSVAVDLGRMAYARVTIANVAREASFQAAQTPTSYLAGQPCSSSNPDTNLVICRAILESTGSVVTVAPADITLTCSPTCTAAMGNTVTVRATGRFSLVTPVMGLFFGGQTITFSSTATNQISAFPPSATAAPTGAPTAAPTAAPTGTAAPTATPAPTAAPSCASVSAGFTYVITPDPNTDRSPVVVTVTDTTTYNPLCVTVWAWSWGDGVTTFGQAQAAHTYLNPGPGNKHFTLSLTVTSGTFTSTTGGNSITVKP